MKKTILLVFAFVALIGTGCAGFDGEGWGITDSYGKTTTWRDMRGPTLGDALKGRWHPALERGKYAK